MLYYFFGFMIFIALLNWVLGVLGVEKHVLKTLVFAFILSIAITVCLWISLEMTVANNLEREIVVTNIVTSFFQDDQWWLEDLESAVRDAIVCSIYIGIWLGIVFLVEKWSLKWLPVCENCGQRWTFLKSLNTIRSFNKGMQCQYCGEKQYLSRISRKRFGLLGIIQAPFLLSIAFFDNMSAVHTLVHIFTIIIVYCSLYPFILSVQSVDEKDLPMW